MNIDGIDIGGWPLTVVLLVVLGVLTAIGWWLFRRRRRRELRAELVEKLDRCVERLGLETVWQTPLFEADVYGIHGEIDDFEVRGELWDKSSRDFFRVSIHFPHPVQQTFRVLTRHRQGVEHMWRLREVDTGDEAFDEAFYVYTRADDARRVGGLLTDEIRADLLGIYDRVDGLKMGSNSLYVYVDEAADVALIEALIREAVAAASAVISRAADIVSAEQRQKEQYELASVDQMARQTGESPADRPAFPDGSDEEVVETVVDSSSHFSGGGAPEAGRSGESASSGSAEGPSSSDSAAGGSSSGTEEDSSR